MHQFFNYFVIIVRTTFLFFSVCETNQVANYMVRFPEIGPIWFDEKDWQEWPLDSQAVEQRFCSKVCGDPSWGALKIFTEARHRLVFFDNVDWFLRQNPPSAAHSFEMHSLLAKILTDTKNIQVILSVVYVCCIISV